MEPRLAASQGQTHLPPHLPVIPTHGRGAGWGISLGQSAAPLQGKAHRHFVIRGGVLPRREPTVSGCWVF